MKRTTKHTHIYLFHVFDLDIDEQVRHFIAADSLDTAFERLAECFGGGREGYEFISVQNLGLVLLAKGVGENE